MTPTNQQTLQTQTQTMATTYKHRCANCDTSCSDAVYTDRYAITGGRKTALSRDYYCDQACNFKYTRELMRGGYEDNIRDAESNLLRFKQLMTHNVAVGKTSKTLFAAIRVEKQYVKTLKLLLSHESTLEILKDEMLTLSEATMTYARLVIADEDPPFNNAVKEAKAFYDYTLVGAYDRAQWAMAHYDDERDILTRWFGETAAIVD